MPITLEDLFAHCPHTLPFFLNALDAHALSQVTPYLSSDVETHHARHGFLLTGSFSTLAGRVHQRGHTDSSYPAFARFFHPSDICADTAPGSHGGCYVADAGNHSIRHITREGIVSTIAGGGSSGKCDGKGRAAKFFSPHALTLDPSSNTLFVCDTDNNSIRSIALVGEGESGSASVTTTLSGGKAGSFSSPGGIAFNPLGATLYVSDSGHNCLKRIAAFNHSEGGSKATIIPLLLDGFTLKHPRGLALCGPILYICDMAHHRVVAWDTREDGKAWVVAGGQSRGPHGAPLGGHRDGPVGTALFNHPVGVCVCPSQRRLFVSDYSNCSVRVIDLAGGVVSTLVDKRPGKLDFPQGLCLSKQGGLLIANTVANSISLVL